MPPLSLVFDILKELKDKGSSSIQINHKLIGFLFNKDDLKYTLSIAGTVFIPMINFTLTSYISIVGILMIDLRVSVPSGYFNQINEMVGQDISLFRSISGDTQLLTTVKLTEISGNENAEAIVLFGTGVDITPESNSVLSESSTVYERVINGIKAIRVADNPNIKYGNTLNYNKGSSIKVGRVVTFIGHDQRFTEVTAL